jgi:hypothetical protein
MVLVVPLRVGTSREATNVLEAKALAAAAYA